MSVSTAMVHMPNNLVIMLCGAYSSLIYQTPRVRILRSEYDGTRWRTGGEVKGKLANGVGSQYSHTTSQRGVSTITNADAHTSAASSRLNRLPRRFKRTRPFRRKTKCGFCACAIRFRASSTARLFVKLVYLQFKSEAAILKSLTSYSPLRKSSNTSVEVLTR